MYVNRINKKDLPVLFLGENNFKSLLWRHYVDLYTSCVSVSLKKIINIDVIYLMPVTEINDA